MRTSFFSRILDLVSPRACAICGRRLSVNESVLCTACHVHLPLTHFWLSPRDNPLARQLYGQMPLAGGHDGQNPNSLERASALFFYSPHSPVSKVIYDMKYHGERNYAEAMGRIAATTMMEGGFFDGIDRLVPVPLTWRRQFGRGYNQSHEIAIGVSSVTGIPVCSDILKRVSFAGSQTRRQAHERQTNVENAFRLVNAAEASGHHILLIDDIVTTGATVIACAQQLCQAHDVRISILALGMTKQ